MFSLLLHHARIFSTYRDALPWTNRANMIHINGCITGSSDSWAKLNSRSLLLSITFAASVRQLLQTQESIASAVPMVRSAPGKCHQVLQVSQQILFSFAGEKSLWAIKNVPIPQQARKYKWLVKHCNIVHNIKTKFHVKFNSLIQRGPPCVQTMKKPCQTPQFHIWASVWV